MHYTWELYLNYTCIVYYIIFKITNQNDKSLFSEVKTSKNVLFPK